MADERVILCGGVAAPRGVRNSACLPLRLDGVGRNVFRELDDIYRGIFTPLPAAFADLLDIACYVYAADQAVPRSGANEGDFAANWRRALSFRVPVRVPDLWRSPAVLDALVSTLSFLSEDEYRFDFLPVVSPDTPFGSLDFGSTRYDGCVDEVVLCSGGLDSIGGAVREVVTDRRKVLLVNHRSNPKPGPRYERLVEHLDRHAGDRRPFHVRVRVNKDSRLSLETTQRSRSFLFATLGAVFARMIGLPRVRFYENGVVSLNLPIGRQVLGARASRTTHPRVLAGFSRLFSLLADGPFAVENPFLPFTKTDVVKSILDAGCGDLIRDTVSCAETRGRSNRHPHCGDCSQCIDRRFGVLAAGAAEFDPADGYEVDLLAGSREGEGARTLLASYLDMTNRVGRMTADEFAGRFGEVSRVLRHLPGHPRDALAEVYRLYRRHAEQVNGAVDQELAAAGATGRFRDPGLPPDCLIRLMADAEAEPVPETTAAEPPNEFRRSGRAYTVRFEGGERFVLLPTKGAAYLHALLSRPGGTVSATAVASQVARRRVELGLGTAGKRADRESLSAIHGRMAELREDIEKAKENNDPAAQEQAERELEALAGELRSCKDIRGKIRALGDEREKVRKAVYNALRRVFEEVAESDPALAEHLEQNVERGHTLLYRSVGVDWHT